MEDNGKSLPLSVRSPATAIGHLDIPVVARFPSPESESSKSITARLDYVIDRQFLTLSGHHDDGNYQLHVEVTVIGGASDLNETADDSDTVSVTGVIVQFEQAYYDAVEACVARFKGVSDKYAKHKSRVSARLPACAT